MESNTVKLSNLQYLEINQVIAPLADKYKPEYIFCFGCVNETYVLSSCFASAIRRNDNHYFLLMVTADSGRIDNEVQNFISACTSPAKVTIITHSLEVVKNSIFQGNRFFSAVCRQGVQLFSLNGLTLNIDYPELNPATTFNKAQKHFYHRFGMATGFLESACAAYDNGFYSNCIFELHQAAEQACIALIRIHTAYRVESHNLSRLLELSKCFSREITGIFLRKSEEEIRLFQVLLKSYSEARYKDDFVASDIDADKLYSLVNAFLQCVKKICNEKLSDYRKTAEDAGKAITEPIPMLPASLFV